MIYTELTTKAMRLAYAAHHGQTDCNGVPYIFHPFHVAEQMTDEISVCVALLHDVVEDTSVTLDDLRREFPNEIVRAVSLLTHNSSDDYCEYIQKIKQDQYARAVKIADVLHNSDQSRMVDPDAVSEKKKNHWKEKYAKALELLTK
ncbi:MAG: HD domain-containing protein [Alistipes sp.]|nr:HD domain-containing protein [Alistipes sp.]